MSTSHRAGGTPPRPGDPPRRPTSAGSNASLSKMVSASGRWGIGSFLGGLVAVIAAVILHDHAAYPNMLCNTGLGQIGETFSSQVRVDCGFAGTAESVVGWLVALGVLSMVGGLGKIGLGLAGGIVPPVKASGRNRPSTAAAQAPDASTVGPTSPSAGAQAPYGAAQAPFGYATPASTSAPVAPAVTPSPRSVMPERPAIWAPPPPPPGSAGPFRPEV
jgi:hypothetical protein